MDSELEDDSEKLSKAIPVLSDYVKGLGTRVKERYLAKIPVNGVDPASIPKEQFNGECLPPIEVSDLLGYLVLETSHYTRKEFKAYKSLNAYNQMVSGFVQSVRGKLIILNPTGWLTSDIVHKAQVLLHEENQSIEGFQRPTLGPVRNFDVVSGEFIQILHTGSAHWVCVSNIGC